MLSVTSPILYIWKRNNDAQMKRVDELQGSRLKIGDCQQLQSYTMGSYRVFLYHVMCNVEASVFLQLTLWIHAYDVQQLRF